MTAYNAGQPLPTRLLDLLRHLVRYLESDTAAAAILIQAEAATLVRGSATMIDLLPPTDAPRIELPNGPIAVRAFVESPGADPTGEILVWVLDGELIGIEQAWWTDDPPTDWPVPGIVRVA